MAEQVDELRRLGVGGDVSVAERQAEYAVRQPAHIGDVDGMSSGEETGGSRLAYDIIDRREGGCWHTLLHPCDHQFKITA